MYKKRLICLHSRQQVGLKASTGSPPLILPPTTLLRVSVDKFQWPHSR